LEIFAFKAGRLQVCMSARAQARKSMHRVGRGDEDEARRDR
jgi:hypothetical protein